MELKYYNSYLEVDLDVIRENLRKAQRHLAPAGIIPVCKGDALGMGAVPVARVSSVRKKRSRRVIASAPRARRSTKPSRAACRAVAFHA